MTSKRVAAFLAIVLVTMAGLACGSTGSTEQSLAPSASRCVIASSQQMEFIRAGVQGVQDSNDVRTGQAVRSNDFERIWFVAAKIYGPGIEDGTGPGVWAITGAKTSPGLVMSVDPHAQSFSDFPDASQTDSRIRMSDDGAREAERCAE